MTTWLKEQLFRITQREEERVPIQSKCCYPDGTIGKTTARIAFQDYVMRHGTSQSFERLHERGGFGCQEIAMHLRGMIARQADELTKKDEEIKRLKEKLNHGRN